MQVPLSTFFWVRLVFVWVAPTLLDGLHLLSWWLWVQWGSGVCYPLVAQRLVFLLVVPRVVDWGWLVLSSFVIDAVGSFWWHLDQFVTLGMYHLHGASWVCGNGRVVLELGQLTSFLWGHLA